MAIAALNLADQAEQDLIQAMASFEKDPLGWVYFSFPWAEQGSELQEREGPEAWQVAVLTHVSEKLQSGAMSAGQALDYVIQVAVRSGHGIGKSAMVAWIILWALSTFTDTKGIVTANTKAQLVTKTWPELGKWHRLFIAAHWFVFNATSIHSADPLHEKTWRFDAVTWSLNNTEAFAGLHNHGKRLVVIMDEASGIADKVHEVTEGALTDADTQILWFQFGNCTRKSGKFFQAFKKLRHRWFSLTVDSRTVSHTNKAQIQKWVDDYGEDSDFVRVRVRGLEPNASDGQFIPNNLVDAASGKHLQPHQYSFAPKIIGVDPAYSGDDEIAIVLRQGLTAKVLATYRKLEDDVKLAGYIAQFEDSEQADAVFVDMGYGTGIVSAGKALKRKWILVPFGGASSKPGFANKRAEMWADAKQWLKDGGAFPADEVLEADLIGPEAYVNLKGQIQLEAKDDMKARGIASPNRGDALALTFAFPVQKKDPDSVSPGGLEFGNGGKAYDPFGQSQAASANAGRTYDPFAR